MERRRAAVGWRHRARVVPRSAAPDSQLLGWDSCLIPRLSPAYQVMFMLAPVSNPPPGYGKAQRIGSCRCAIVTPADGKSAGG